jgi:predicted SAM-dependent methyltransferase
MFRINVGCGMSPTAGWINVDNSFSVKLSRFGLLSSVFHYVKLIDRTQMNYIRFCQKNNIVWADVTKRIPLPNSSTAVLYSSHMFEHLDREDAVLFLSEAMRVLAPEGIIRLAVPDIQSLIQLYAKKLDADWFVASTQMSVPRPRSSLQKLRNLVVGPRHHLWMYDGNSLCKLLTSAGFLSAKTLAPGETRIANSDPLDLFERAEGSVCVEAVRPHAVV